MSAPLRQSAKLKFSKRAARERVHIPPPTLVLYHKTEGMSTHFFTNFFTIFVDKSIPALYTYSMKNENKRPTKKALVQALLDKGVDKKIVDSLQRANIDTMQFVLKAIS